MGGMVVLYHQILTGTFFIFFNFISFNPAVARPFSRKPLVLDPHSRNHLL